jgi:hypothetical protein
MQLTVFDLLLWTAGFVAHISLIFVLVRRRRYQAFPLFTAFIAANAIRTIILYLVQQHGTRSSYFYTFWSLALLDTLLQLSVVYEMYSSTFRPLGVWARDIRRAFVWLIGVSVIIAASLSCMAAPVTQQWIQAIVIKGSFFSSAWISELLVGMIFLSVNAGLPWKTHVARISTGLGIYSGVDILIETAHAYFGVDRTSTAYETLSHLRMTAYLCTVGYWVMMLWRNAPESETLSEELRQQLAILQKRVEYDLQRLRSGRW